jgi:antitoxin component YwqK of YwqJK toxin-antitoxin module
METEIKREYWSNGKLYLERAYVGGVRNGLTKWWWESGKLCSEYPYVDGKLHGMEKWWRRGGDIYEFRLYNQDELVAKFYPRNETQRWKLK